MIPFINKTEVTSKPALVGAVTPVTPVKPVTNSLQSAHDFSPGKKYLATVETRLPNGQSKVLITNQTIQMHLPENIRPGDKIELVLIAREPQLKFLLKNDALLSSAKNSLNIGVTGRLLSFLAQDSANATTAKPLTSTTPILTSPPINNAQTPALLQKALSQSGLFYESHQAQWITGKRTLAQLQQEPQGKINVTPATTTALLNADTPIHNQSLPLVQHQLTTLESGQILWRGEVWPEQLMDWEITEQTADENEQNDAETPSQWQTKLHFTLPKLGEISATLIFNADNVQINLHAQTTETAALLRDNHAPLATALLLAGLNVKALETHANTEE